MFFGELTLAHASEFVLFFLMETISFCDEKPPPEKTQSGEYEKLG
jgi:hypothetical protein